MGRERQRGAIGIPAAATLLLALICLALVVDTGRLYLEQRKLQRVVDSAALETATQSGMCGSQSAGQIQSYAASSAAGNGFVAGSGDSLVATLGSVQLDSGYGGAQSRRTFSAGGDPADSIQVKATHTVPSSLILNLASVFTGASATTTLSAQAVARRTAMGGLSAGTSLATLDSQQSVLLNSLLNNLLGSNLSLNAVGYRGLANANVSLLGLSDQLRAAGVNVAAGSVDSLLGTQASLGQLLGATVKAIDPTKAANVDTVLLGQQLLGAGVKTATVTLGSVLSVIAPDSVRDEALQGSVNVLDLITALAFVANRQHAVTLNAGVNLANLAAVQVRLWIIEPPQIALGYPGKGSDGQWRTQVRTAAIRTDVKGTLGIPGILTVDIGLAASVAQGMAALDTIACGGVGKPVDVSVYAQPGIAQLSLGYYTNIQNGTALVPIRVDVLDGAVRLDIAADAVVADANGTTLNYRVTQPSDLPSESQTADSSLGDSLDNAIATLSRTLTVKPTLLGGDWGGLISASLGPLLGTVLSTLRPAVTALGHVVLDPLLRLLGIGLGTIDVRLIDLQTSGAELLI
ncbi:pilus assembly protein TadG-related protein [Pseudomonas sp. ZM23]|uniref:Pilus assembly protein TadG-related protein n=1 Tax=Pseudomonas triclosanedens TaxID=2961893 RepID=A0ABY7A3W6_9PSED|nr:pilus assembly protein TadG-related protein [Pseudomonas triclosanedens]MCP8464696.1 pilus assembly protein TadG-related protein [Pseudomonas triclosanedens]MCP8473627.1 pilus assembly protein TadG-related protein [Pseudomonas triclosanedens]MCP8478464.1 pilus assembly protein TadG-related protein [Pseudomonas triclosanedens]WAI50823.1 pilus assembly protein TadG-related protein [Pseudomonas triclosanedens]